MIIFFSILWRYHPIVSWPQVSDDSDVDIIENILYLISCISFPFFKISPLVTSEALQCERTSRLFPLREQVGQLYCNKELPSQHRNMSELAHIESSEGGRIWANSREGAGMGQDIARRCSTILHHLGPSDATWGKGWDAILIEQTGGAETAIVPGWLVLREEQRKVKINCNTPKLTIIDKGFQRHKNHLTPFPHVQASSKNPHLAETQGKRKDGEAQLPRNNRINGYRESWSIIIKA